MGIDPERSEQLVGLLDDASASLGGQAARVQSLLDQAGITTTVPAEIREVSRMCGDGAVDLRRRAGLIRSPIRARGGPSAGVVVRGWREFWRTPGPTKPPSPCGPTTPALEKPLLPSPSTAQRPDLPLAGVRPGPLVRPVGVGRARPWARPGTLTGPWGDDLAPGPMPNTMTTAVVPRCDTVHSTPKGGWRPGLPVDPPKGGLPAFPDAVADNPRTPVKGGGGLRRRWKGPDGKIYEWDRQHGTVEVYDKKGRHRGEFDPVTGARTKPADPTRKPVK